MQVVVPLVEQLLADGWTMLRQWLPNGWPSAGQWLTNGEPMVDQWLATCALSLKCGYITT